MRESKPNAKRNANHVVCARWDQLSDIERITQESVRKMVHLRFSNAPVNCFPIERRIPAVTALIPSKTWKSATTGKMEATITTTSSSLLNRYAHELRKVVNMVLRRVTCKHQLICVRQTSYIPPNHCDHKRQEHRSLICIRSTNCVFLT